MSTIPQQSEPHPALAYDCPFCGAKPDQPCHARRGDGGEVRLHSRRVRVWRASEYPEDFAAVSLPALCCECGNLRNVSSNFFFPQDDENRASECDFGDPRGWRCTGTLKCDQCRRPTRHAVIRKHDGHQNYLEELQQHVLGGEWNGRYQPDRDRLRGAYISQFPRNPYLHHRYWVSEAHAAWDSGRSEVTALCGAPMKLERDPSTPWERPPVDELVAPCEVRDQDYEDANTGLWWMEMDCVDCLRVANRNRLQFQRRELEARLLRMAAHVQELDAAAVALVHRHLDELGYDGEQPGAE